MNECDKISVERFIERFKENESFEELYKALKTVIDQYVDCAEQLGKFASEIYEVCCIVEEKERFR